jgi:hypothetical protein
MQVGVAGGFVHLFFVIEDIDDIDFEWLRGQFEMDVRC